MQSLRFAADTARRITADIRALAATTDPELLASSPYASGKGMRLALLASEGSGFRDYVYLSEDLFLVIGRCTQRQDLEELYLGEGHLKINYHLSGQSFIQLERESPMANDGLNAGFLIQPPGVGKREVSRAGALHEYLTLICSPALLGMLFPDQIDKLPAQLRAFTRGEQVRTGGNFRPSAEMISSVRKLLDSVYSGTLRTVHSEAIALELLCATVATLTGGGVNVGSRRLKKRDMDRLDEAATLLRKEWQHPPTLAQLARQLGINQSKLTQGFRQRFGVTIAEYCQAHRMAEAARLLTDDALPVYRVAELVGYEFPGNFTAAFKRHFGVSPRRYRD